ncbi:MAG: hypothetical protein ACJ8GJ_06775 [Vitreoscilla sp.]
MTTVDRPAPPGIRTHMFIVALVLSVGVILNGLSELGTLVYAAWMALTLPILAALALVSGWQLFDEFDRRRRAHLAARAWQLALAAGAVVLLPMLGEIHDLVDVAKCHARLHAAAWADANGPGPHLAVIQTGEFLTAVWGYVYDDSGEIRKPCGTQSPAWLARAAQVQFGNFEYCSANLSHVIGPYYRWGQR